MFVMSTIFHRIPIYIYIYISNIIFPYHNVTYFFAGTLSVAVSFVPWRQETSLFLNEGLLAMAQGDYARARRWKAKSVAEKWEITGFW